MYVLSSPRPTGVCHGVHVIHHVIHLSYIGLAARIALVISFFLLRQQNLSIPSRRCICMSRAPLRSYVLRLHHHTRRRSRGSWMRGRFPPQQRDSEGSPFLGSTIFRCRHTHGISTCAVTYSAFIIILGVVLEDRGCEAGSLRNNEILRGAPSSDPRYSAADTRTEYQPVQLRTPPSSSYSASFSRIVDARQVPSATTRFCPPPTALSSSCVYRTSYFLQNILWSAMGPACGPLNGVALRECKPLAVSAMRPTPLFRPQVPRAGQNLNSQQCSFPLVPV